MWGPFPSSLKHFFMFRWIFRPFPDANFDQPQMLLCSFSAANSDDPPVAELVARSTDGSFSWSVTVRSVHEWSRSPTLADSKGILLLEVFEAMVGGSTSTGSFWHESWADTSSVGVCSLLSAVFPGVFPFSHSHSGWHIHIKTRGQKR